MINVSFSLSNPFSNRFDILLCKEDATPIKNKCYEFQVNRSSTIIGLTFNLTFRQSHAGCYISVELFGYDVMFNFYDVRHWNCTQGKWEEYDEN